MRIEKTECNYQVTECDLKFGEQITLNDELLIPVSVLDKIRTEIEFFADADAYGDYQQGFSDGLMRAVQIIDKYKAESEDKE